MRIARLDLTRYGKFTDRRIEFGAATAGSPDLHIVYGPNEAGKSTLFSAWLDLLFGIETRSAYGFLHPYATMRVGAALEAKGWRETVARLKRQQNSLVNADDQPLPETLLTGVLGGLDRAGYQKMFSLDDVSLEDGGEAILKSEGELGGCCSRPVPASPTPPPCSNSCAARPISSSARRAASIASAK